MELFWMYQEETDPVADLIAHQNLLFEAKMALRWAEYIGDKKKAIRLYEEISYRRSEIKQLTRTVRTRQTA